MQDRAKLSLSIYGIVSGITFIYLMLAVNPGVSVPIFFIVQTIHLYIASKEKAKDIKGLLFMVPIFVISLNHFISLNHMWGPTNFLAVVFLYSAMFLALNDKLNLKKLNVLKIIRVIINIFEPMINFIVPVRWIGERSKNKEKSMLAKRILIGVIISIPCVVFLTMMLSSADMIFYNNFKMLNEWIEEFFSELQIIKLIIGAFVGLYLFGHLYNVFYKEEDLVVLNENNASIKQLSGDLVVLNILLASILVIYSIFIAIQFRYLFSSGELPYGLNYAEYARRGFFELVFLSVLNIGLIMLTTYLLKDKIYGEKNKWALFSKGMMIYLCLVTGVLLISSYYRMSLYDSVYGFTRLRVLVYMFLIFEGLGLIATLIYIIKHSFNIWVVYAGIFLAFYMTINIVKIDRIIAKRNIDMYLSGQTENFDIEYLIMLSHDTVPEVVRLLDEDVDRNIRTRTRDYLFRLKEEYVDSEDSWRSYNLSAENNKRVLIENMDKFK